MKNKIKFAILGAGHIGKRHAEMVERNEHCELVAICDIKDKEELGLEQFNVPFFGSEDEMISSINFDVLCVTTPNGLHAEHCLKGLKANKHIVVEKPMALTKAHCEKIIYKALQRNKHIFCVMQNRYSPPSQWIKSLIQDKKLGEIYMVQINCYWNRDDRYYKKDNWKGDRKLDGGTLFTQFSHFIDIMYWLFGDIKDIQCKFNNFSHKDSIDFEDSGFINFNFVDGGMGSINYSTSVWNQNFESSLTVVAEKGTVKIGGQYMNEVEVCNIKDYKMPELPPANPANNYGTYKGSAANHNYIFENVVDVINNGKPATTNALEGMKVVDMIERIYEQNTFRLK
jgi:predicted dehydrogenase